MGINSSHSILPTLFESLCTNLPELGQGFLHTRRYAAWPFFADRSHHLGQVCEAALLELLIQVDVEG